jgi:hypothetical protein
MSQAPLLTRTKIFSDKKYWLTTNSIKSSYDKKWSNCLYLHFAKEDFPNICSPNLVACNWGGQKQRFDYSNSILNKLDFHGRITFYEEVKSIELDRTYVKVGCDYQHHGDDHWREADNGDFILEHDGLKIASQFEEMFCQDNKPPTSKESADMEIRFFNCSPNGQSMK